MYILSLVYGTFVEVSSDSGILLTCVYFWHKELRPV